MSLINPYGDFSDFIYDVTDLTDLICSLAHNNQQTTLRRILAATSFTKTGSSPNFGYSVGGFNYENMYFKGALPLLMVNRNDANPALVFQEHCFTERGNNKLRHILVDPAVSLGNQSFTINSNTIIEGAVFDHTGDTYSRLHIGGLATVTATITGTGPTGVNINMANIDTNKINVGDYVRYVDGANIRWGEVTTVVDSNNVTVSFTSTLVGTGINKTVNIFKRNIRFKNCLFYNQVHIENTYNVEFLDCQFVYDDASKLGGIVCDAATVNNENRIFNTLIDGCDFVWESLNMTNTPNPSALTSAIALDRANNVTVVANSFFHRTTGVVNANIRPITASANAAYQRESGGHFACNTMRGFPNPPTNATLLAEIQRVCILGGTANPNHNTRDNAII